MNDSALLEQGCKFQDKEDRMNFVKKVYGILGVQISITAIGVLIPVLNDNAA